ncbi:hypothetical protein [Sinanaerobacter sp. ZZT-01]|uniref:hypothetical protein n=1 Tax=Sinanaerobacter sp. ZZT-01 TaxID=3111540 RepID=UPI002D788579|nr:hypothetical protein [Sinanaerobacter sp. ZZT-01]WRR94654.1 hypothetical protein U5921_05955 [Sinanaerobacter sp. ZZT-01]
MEKLGFIMASILSIIGCNFLFITLLIDKTLPIIGKMASQLSTTKEYSDVMYQANYELAYIFSILIITVGIVCALYFFFKGEKQC